MYKSHARQVDKNCKAPVVELDQHLDAKIKYEENT